MTPRLTDRQWEVLRLRALGYTAQEIGGMLFVTESTVKNHLAYAYRKLEVRCIVDALRAIGWLEVPQ